MKALVVGSTGQLGRQVARGLAEDGHTVSGLVRVSSDKAVVSQLHQWGVDTVVGDLKDPASLRRACAGADTVITTASALGADGPEDTLVAVDQEGQKALIDAAVNAEVGRLIFVSILGIRANSPFTAAKLAVEEHLTRSSIDFVTVQPSIFMDVWLSPHVGFDWQGGHATVYGEGTSPMAWVAIPDVAAILRAVATDGTFSRTVLPILGPEALTPNEVVAIFEQVTGRAFETEYVPTAALEAQRADAAHPVEQAFASLMLRYAAGDPPNVERPSGLPIPQTTVEAYARGLVDVA